MNQSHELDDMDLEPSSEDIVITTEGRLGCRYVAYYSGRAIATAIEYGDVETMLKTWMETNKYWPSIWILSDHGNFHLTTI